MTVQTAMQQDKQHLNVLQPATLKHRIFLLSKLLTTCRHYVVVQFTGKRWWNEAYRGISYLDYLEEVSLGNRLQMKIHIL